MDAAKIPDDEKSWSCVDIFLFSNGQQYSPPRKYHLHSEDLQCWDTTLHYLAQSHHGSMHSVIELYNLDGRKIEGPLELRNGSMYVAVEPPDTFIQSGYEKYTMKALRSWQKRHTRKASFNEIEEINNENEHHKTNSLNNHDILETITSNLQSMTLRETSPAIKPSEKKKPPNAAIAPRAVARNTKAVKKFPPPDKNESFKRRETIFKKNTKITPRNIYNTNKDILEEVALTKSKIITSDWQLQEALPIDTILPKGTSNGKKVFSSTKVISYNNNNELTDKNKLRNTNKVSSQLVSATNCKSLKSNNQLKNTILSDILTTGDLTTEKEVSTSAKVINTNNRNEVVEKNKLDLAIIADVSDIYKNSENEMSSLLINVPLSKIEYGIYAKTKEPLIGEENENENMGEYIGPPTNYITNDDDENCNRSEGRQKSCHSLRRDKSDTNILQAFPEGSPDIETIMTDKAGKAKDQCVMVINQGDILSLKLDIEVRNTKGRISTKHNIQYLNYLNTKTERESQVEIDLCHSQTSVSVNNGEVVVCTCDENVNADGALTVKTEPLYEETQRCDCSKKDHKRNKEQEHATQNTNDPVLNKQRTGEKDSEFSSQRAVINNMSKSSICEEVHKTECSTQNCKDLGMHKQSIDNILASQHIAINVICKSDNKASDAREPNYVLDESVAEKCQKYENNFHLPNNKPDMISLLTQAHNHMTDASTQTEWCNIMLEARRCENDHYTFHLPPLHVLKQYKLQ